MPDLSTVARPLSARRLWLLLPVTLSDRRLRAAAAVVILLHLTLAVTVQWAIFESLLAPALGGVPPGIAARLAALGWRTVAIELTALGLGGVAAIAVLQGRPRLNIARFVSVFLIAWSPVALYSAGILLALATGWEPQVQIFSSREATDAEVADTIREAMPVIMHPLTMGRHVANGTSILLLAVLLSRLCGIDAKRSIAAAVVVLGVATLAALLA